jgi:hypothetical protein
VSEIASFWKQIDDIQHSLRSLNSFADYHRFEILNSSGGHFVARNKQRSGDVITAKSAEELGDKIEAFRKRVPRS